MTEQELRDQAMRTAVRQLAEAFERAEQKEQEAAALGHGQSND